MPPDDIMPEPSQPSGGTGPTAFGGLEESLRALGRVEAHFAVSPSQRAGLEALMRMHTRMTGATLGRVLDRAGAAIAQVLFDSLRDQRGAIAGFRSASPATTRVVHFALEDAGEITVRTDPPDGGGRCMVTGELRFRAGAGVTQGIALLVWPLDGVTASPMEVGVESDGYFEVVLAQGRYALDVVSGTRVMSTIACLEVPAGTGGSADDGRSGAPGQT